MIENLMAIAVVSLVLLGVIAGFLTSTATAGRAGRRAQAEAALNAVAEQLPRVAYRPCATLDQVRADLTAIVPPSPHRLVVTDVAYLDAAGGFGAACGATDRGAQRFGLRIDTLGADDRYDGQVVHRNPGARP